MAHAIYVADWVAECPHSSQTACHGRYSRLLAYFSSYLFQGGLLAYHIKTRAYVSFHDFHENGPERMSVFF